MRGYRRGWVVGMNANEGPENKGSRVGLYLLEPALLLLIGENPRHGYTLLNELETLGVKNLHPSVIYRVLRKLEFMECIHSGWDTSQTQGPPRRNYILTEQGQKALQIWMEELGKTKEMVSVLVERLSNLEKR